MRFCSLEIKPREKKQKKMRKWLYLSIGLNVVGLLAAFLAIQSLGGLNYVLYKMKNRGITGIYEHRKNLFDLMPSDTASIVFLGNSLTAYCEWAELLDNPRIQNRGIPGDMTGGLMRRLPAVLRSQPDQIFLMIGVNDLLFLPPQQIAANYRNIVNHILEKSPETQLLLQSLLPINNEVRMTGVDNQDILNLNEQIKALAGEKGLTYIDLHRLMSDEKGQLKGELTRDGVHLDGAAYLIWAEAVKPFLKEKEAN